MSHHSDPLPHLTKHEKRLIHVFNSDPGWTRERLLQTLRQLLQVALEIELSTLPIYLYTYYSLNRTLGSADSPPETAYSRTALFANRAGGQIMSIAVEEMLHMSLASNLLYAVGGQPEAYLRSPSAFPTNLLAHATNGPDGKPLLIPLAKFSYEQLWRFLEIEYPEPRDAIPEDGSWQTLGQLYSYLRCIVSSDKLHDDDFRQHPAEHQIQPTNYSPNNIDTVYPDHNFNQALAPAQANSAASHARFPNAADSHAGRAELIVIHSRHDALAAIATVCDQGEGLDHTRWDDPSRAELSHYYKFLSLQSQLQGYPQSDRLPPIPRPHAAAAQPFSATELDAVVFNLPENPVTAEYPQDLQVVSNFCNGLYQYMLIMTETIFKVPGTEQKLYFNRAMHLSMIWMLDKLIQAMRAMVIAQGKWQGRALAPTFENYSLGTRDQAYGNLVALGTAMAAQQPSLAWIVTTYLTTNNVGTRLPDVSAYWRAPAPVVDATSPYANVPMFPAHPPLPGAVEAHACMGLNSCRGQDRFGPAGHPDPDCANASVTNACAGQGYCATAVDHTCHVLNSCKHQGGCGLYGTAGEQDNPGANACQSLGSCATPINAERFSSDGANAGKSVWLRARQVFLEKRWPAIARERGLDPHQLPEPPHPALFANGPTFAWVSQNPDAGMTACGASGMSGANSCA